MARRISLIFVVALLVVVALPVHAGSSRSAVFSISCKGFTGISGNILLDRDNTGEKSEAFIVSATDGSGKIVYEPKQDSFFVGGNVAWTGGTLYEWTAAPVFNPITLRIVSPAGNDLPAELITLASGTCAGLPRYGILPGVGQFVPGDTSPSVDANEVPPRPNDALDVSQDLVGYLVVNIDNLSLRSGDAPEYSLVGIVDGGSILIPLGRNQDFTWWYVQIGDLIGWVKAEFLVVRGNLTDVPVVEAAGELTPVTLVVFLDQPLLSAPRDTALPLCTIGGDHAYTVIGRNRSETWYEVQATCDNVVVNGWLDAVVGALRNPAGVPIPVSS